MSSPWQLRVYDKQELACSLQLTGPAELGRQSEGEEGPFAQKPQADGRRVIIARLDEDSVSRRHARVEPLPGNRARVVNLSAKLTVRLPDGNDLRPGASCDLPLPASLTLGKKVVRVMAAEEAAAPPGALHSLAEVSVPPGHYAGPSRFPAFSLAAAGPAMDSESLVKWLQAAMDVFQSATGTTGFFTRAARAVVELVGLDAGRVLLLEEGRWQKQAEYVATRTAADSEWVPSRQVLGSVVKEKKAFWEAQSAGPAASLIGVKAVVAAPILNRAGEVIGAVYGDRRQDGRAGPITKLEAMLVSLLASGVAAGLSRLEQEQAALRARVQFEQFFTPELSRHLELEPRLLEGRDVEVTVLFCDIRRFSRVSERLGPARTVEWTRDVLSTLSRCVLGRQGVLVDYVGDELMAMWGAPVEQPDHDERACLAALDMMAALPALSERWQAVLQEPLDVGIGINTGPARVGNVGSDVKFKYGPIGNTVNLGSRVQGATKYLRTRLLITGSTRGRLRPALQTRRLCQVRVVNIVEPVELYELVGEGAAGWAGLKAGYEEALGHFEQGQFRQAARLLGQLLPEHPHDGPTLVLNSRVADCLLDGAANFDPVWELPGK